MTDLTVRLHAWSTRFHLGLVFSQVTCLTAGSYEPHARKEVTNWEDHSPHSRDVQHTDGEDSAMPLASFQKRREEFSWKAQRQQILNSTTDTAHHREQSKICCAKANEVGERHLLLKCAAKMSHLET